MFAFWQAMCNTPEYPDRCMSSFYMKLRQVVEIAFNEYA